MVPCRIEVEAAVSKEDGDAEVGEAAEAARSAADELDASVDAFAGRVGDGMASIWRAGASSVLGLRAAACVARLQSLWQMKTATEQLVALALAFEGDALSKIVHVVYEQASGKSPGE
jgi:hypothetical protein